MGRYMDAAGFRRRDWQDSKRHIKRGERWIRELLSRGATIPEAMWDIQATLSVACENVRGELVRKASRRRVKG